MATRRFVPLSSTTRTRSPGPGTAGRTSRGFASGAWASDFGAAKGIANRNRLPRTGPHSMPMVPPMSVTSSRQMGRPRPVPLPARMEGPSPCSNGSNSRSRSSGGIAAPSSETSTRSTSRSPSRAARRLTMIVPASANLTAFPTRLASTWPMRTRSPTTRPGTDPSTSCRSVSPFARACARKIASTASTA